MRTNNLKQLSIPLLAATLWLMGCSEAGERLTGPGNVDYGKKIATTTVTESGTLYNYPTRSTAVFEDRWGSSVLDKNGGEVVVGHHRLIVPAGTVRRLTQFTVTVRSGSEMVLDVAAHEQDRQGNWSVEVGANGFANGLALRVKYDGVVVSAGDEPKLKMVRLVQNELAGQVEPKASEVDASNKWVRATIEHSGRHVLGSRK